MSEKTRSDVFRGGGASLPMRVERSALTLVMMATDPMTAPSRHVLDDVDVVAFGRGTRGVVRDCDGEQRRLVLRVPDPVMSSEHGRMLRVQGRWLLEDPRSKNGATIAGKPTRCGIVELGDVVELGHTIFVLDTRMSQSDGPVDQTLAVADRRRQLLATFHPELEAAGNRIAQAATSNVPVLIYGETGTGKEVYAQAVHELSLRPGPFVAVNCGALSSSLLEAELFGHRRGAFSGAVADRPGFVRSADKGTLFLDEIAELSPSGQVALLRVLQEGEVIPVGDSRPVAVDIRVCAASQQPLLRAVEAGRFRSDLYARLLGYELGLPPLRERPFDLGYLVASLLRRMAADRPVTFTPAAVRALISYDWPRNLRELERALGTAIVFARGDAIDLECLPAAIRAAAARGRLAVPQSTDVTAPEHATSESDALRTPEGDALRIQLASKLLEHHGNVSAVARDLGKHREQIQRWLRRFNIDPDGFRK